MDLIAQLKQEHIQIGHSLEAIKGGVSEGKSGDKDLLTELKELKEVLVAHLQLEDSLLYPKLNTSSNEEAKELGTKFSAEMNDISKVALKFFSNYLDMEVNDLKKSAEFRKDLDNVIDALTKRVKAEETILFPAYEKYCK